MLLSQFTPDRVEAGLDEVGRGCLAGPVVAAAVIFPKNYQNETLRDSKKLGKKQRQYLKQIIENEALAYSISEVGNEVIDQVNVLQASILAMHKAVGELKIQPELLLVDGKFFYPYQNLDHECIIKGDDKFLSIAAASVLAKTYRDELMTEYAKRFPHYAWEQNVGYPTKKHYEGIKEYGITCLHRRSFKLFRNEDLF